MNVASNLSCLQTLNNKNTILQNYNIAKILKPYILENKKVKKKENTLSSKKKKKENMYLTKKKKKENKNLNKKKRKKTRT